MPTILRPLSTGEVLDQTFRLYRTHFVLFAGIAAIPQVIVLALNLMSTGLLAAAPSAGSAAVLTGLLVGAGAMIITAVLYLIALTAMHAATVHAVAATYLDKPISIREAYVRVRQRIWRLVGIALALGIAIAAGFILLIVPGVILALMWALTIPVAVIEDLGLSEAVSRSSDLTKGSRGRIFVVALIGVMLTYMALVIFQLPLVAVAVVMGRQTAQAPLWVNVASAIAQFISNTLVGPVLTIAMSLIYYDQRVRKEGLDLQLIMSGITTTEQASGAATAY